MGKFLAGSILVLSVTLCNMATGYFTEGQLTSAEVQRCNSAGNITACQEAAQAGIVEATLATTFTGIEGADFRFNAVWVFIGLSLLSLGVLLIVQSWVPFLGS